MAVKHNYQSPTGDSPTSEISSGEWNADHVIDTDGITFATSATTPTAPAAGNVVLYGKDLGTREMLSAISEGGGPYVLQPSMWRQKVGLGTANVSNGTGYTIDLPAFTFTAALTNAPTNTNHFSRSTRLGAVTTATAGTIASVLNGAAQFTVGDGAGLGGFYASFTFSFVDQASVPDARGFVGMWSSVAAATNVQPNTLTNCFGIGRLSTDQTQLYIVYGGSAAQTAIALGTGFPPILSSTLTGGVLYELSLFSAPGVNGVVHYRVERLDNGSVATGTLGPGTAGTTLPANTTLLTPRAWATNNATAQITSIYFTNIYVETDY